jgi:hypothetical protein
MPSPRTNKTAPRSAYGVRAVEDPGNGGERDDSRAGRGERSAAEAIGHTPGDQKDGDLACSGTAPPRSGAVRRERRATPTARAVLPTPASPPRTGTRLWPARTPATSRSCTSRSRAQPSKLDGEHAAGAPRLRAPRSQEASPRPALGGGRRRANRHPPARPKPPERRSGGRRPRLRTVARAHRRGTSIASRVVAAARNATAPRTLPRSVPCQRIHASCATSSTSVALPSTR